MTRDVRDGFWARPGGSAEQVIGEGTWALPGLVDAHAHLAKETMDPGAGDFEGARGRASLALRSGVGLVLDKGWQDRTVVDLIDKVPPEERPDIEAAGVICAVEGGYWEGFARNIAPGEITEAVGEAADEGRGWVKLIGDWPRKGLGPVANFTEDELAAAVMMAEAHHARVAIHTMAREVPSIAVRAGVHSIEHGLFLSTDDLETLGGRCGTWVPTVVQVERVIRQLGADSSGGRLLLEGLANVASIVGVAVEAGVHVLTGTDMAVGTHQVADEAIRLWEMGMSPGVVVEAISVSALHATGRPAGFEIGAPANVVLFTENPVLVPPVLAHPQRVLRMGRIVR